MTRISAIILISTFVVAPALCLPVGSPLVLRDGIPPINARSLTPNALFPRQHKWFNPAIVASAGSLVTGAMLATSESEYANQSGYYGSTGPTYPPSSATPPADGSADPPASSSSTGSTSSDSTSQSSSTTRSGTTGSPAGSTGA